MSIRRTLAIAVICLAFAAGCGKQEDKKPEGVKPEVASGAEKAALPEGHPSVEGTQAPVGTTPEQLAKGHPSSKVQKEIRLSDDIKKQWNEVELEVADVAAGKKETLKLKVGRKTALGTKGFSILVEALIPDYTMLEDHIGTRSDQPNNPAVFVALYEGDREVGRGWVFKNFPGFNSYKHDKIALALLNPIASGR